MRPWRPRKLLRDRESWPRPGSAWHKILSNLFTAARAAIRMVWLCYLGSLVFVLLHARDTGPWRLQSMILSGVAKQIRSWLT